MTVNKIIQKLDGHYLSGIRYKVGHIYVFKKDWESDYFIQKLSGYCYEFEIKLTRQDFLNDCKKIAKHSILKDGFYKTLNGKVVQHPNRPNRFFYVVPEGLILTREIPQYAGLIYVNDKGVRIVKKAPVLHKEHLKLESALCRKFYQRWIESKRIIWNLELRIEGLIEELKINN